MTQQFSFIKKSREVALRQHWYIYILDLKWEKAAVECWLFFTNQTESAVTSQCVSVICRAQCSLLLLQTRPLREDLLAKGTRNARPAQTSDGHLTPRRANPQPPVNAGGGRWGGLRLHPGALCLSLLRNFNRCQAQRRLALLSASEPLKTNTLAHNSLLFV